MSGALDEDTVRAVDAGRETVGSILSSAQTHLQKVFIVFLAGFLAAFYALRVFVWGYLESMATSRMTGEVLDSTDLITRTPFEVILLQAKIGMFVGVLFAIPALLYFSRDALRRRGFQSAIPITKWYLAGVALTATGLFALGVGYAFTVFFPFMFDFLATSAVSAGIKPSFGITEFTEFVALLTISFGLAAQLPLAMGALSYTEIVPYETFRDKWRHAIIAIFVFGALFSPPDPFTQVMWALPLIGLYVFSLGLAKLLSNTRRRGASEVGSGTGFVKRRALQFGGALAGVFAVAFAALYLDLDRQIAGELLPRLPAYLVPDGPTLFTTLPAEHGLQGEAAVAGLVAVGVGLLALVVITIRVLRSPVYPREGALRAADSPDDVDFDVLGVDDVADVPAIVFQKLSEDEALDIAREAMYEDDREKAQAILDRFDRIQERTGAAAARGASGEAAAASGETTGTAAEEEDESLFASTAAGMLDPFTEDETTEDDIGGYAYDFAFIANSLTSKMFRIVGVAMAVLAGSFFWLYQGGLKNVLARFVGRVPDSVLQEVATRNGVDVDPSASTTELIAALDLVVAIHPVEVLIFMVKVSTLAAIVAVLPMILYYAWPAAKERGLVRGDRRVFLVWGGSLIAGFALGTYLGFYWVAPAVISYLVSDAVTNGMVIAYRIKSFSWLVIFTTVGVGFVVNVVVTMALFHVGGIVHYRTMRAHWRPVVVAIFTAAAFLSPKGILTMLVLAIPLALTYLLGVTVLAIITLGGRLFGGGGGGEPAPEPEAEAVAE